MLKGTIFNGISFTIDDCSIDCEQKDLLPLLEYSANAFETTQHMHTPYEAETLLGEHFVSKYGGEITQPSDQPNTTHWGLSGT